jgi:F0F1-type ATP synthase membrane subunit b/b'
VARIPATPEPAEVDAAPVRSVLDQVLEAEVKDKDVMSTDRLKAAEKRRAAAVGTAGYRDQHELEAIEAERGRFVERKKDTTHIDAEIARRRAALGLTSEKG